MGANARFRTLQHALVMQDVMWTPVKGKCTREKSKFTNGSKESSLKYNIRGNGETDFCLGFVAQWFIHWYSVIDPGFNPGRKVQSWTEVSFYLVRPVFHEHLTVYTKGTYVCHISIQPYSIGPHWAREYVASADVWVWTILIFLK